MLSYPTRLCMLSLLCLLLLLYMLLALLMELYRQGRAAVPDACNKNLQA